MALEDLSHVVLVVPADHDEEQPTFLEALELTLEELEAPSRAVRAELQPVEADLADDPAPQGVVAVEGDHLRGGSARAPDVPDQGDRELLKQSLRIAAAGQNLELTVPGMFDADPLDDVRKVEQVDPRDAGETFPPPLAQRLGPLAVHDRERRDDRREGADEEATRVPAQHARRHRASRRARSMASFRSAARSSSRASTTVTLSLAAIG